MQYWLMKSEPETWSWEQQVKAGARGEGWDGVRNYQASNNMKKMKKGDLCFFYHSVKERDVVGVVKVVKEYHPDPTDKSCLLYTSPSPRDATLSRMPSSA